MNWLQNRLYIELMKASEQPNEWANMQGGKCPKKRKLTAFLYQGIWIRTRSKNHSIEYNWIKWILRVEYFIVRVIVSFTSSLGSLKWKLRIFAIWNRLRATCKHGISGFSSSCDSLITTDLHLGCMINSYANECGIEWKNPHEPT